MTFISNVTFRPHCIKCKGPGARSHSIYGHICPDCYYAIRLDEMFAQRADQIDLY